VTVLNSSILAMEADRTLASLFARVQPLCEETLWLGGSTLRNLLDPSEPQERADVDMFFFNRNELSKSYEEDIEAKLREESGNPLLSVKNQARMGLVSDGLQYECLLQTVAAFPDTSIAVAARIFDSAPRTALVFAPYGLPSRRSRIIQPTFAYLARHGVPAFYSWLERKKYEARMRHWRIEIAGQRPLARSQFS